MEFKVTWTSDRGSKKRKSWNDGFITIDANGSSVKVFKAVDDEKGDRVFSISSVKSDQLDQLKEGEEVQLSSSFSVCAEVIPAVQQKEVLPVPPPSTSTSSGLYRPPLMSTLSQQFKPPTSSVSRFKPPGSTSFSTSSRIGSVGPQFKPPGSTSSSTSSRIGSVGPQFKPPGSTSSSTSSRIGSVGQQFKPPGVHTGNAVLGNSVFDENVDGNAIAMKVEEIEEEEEMDLVSFLKMQQKQGQGGASSVSVANGTHSSTAGADAGEGYQVTIANKGPAPAPVARAVKAAAAAAAVEHESQGLREAKDSDCVVSLPAGSQAIDRRRIRLSDHFPSAERYCLELTAALAEEIHIALARGMQESLTLARKALGFPSKVSERPSVLDESRARDLAQVKRVLQTKLPFFMGSTRVFVSTFSTEPVIDVAPGSSSSSSSSSNTDDGAKKPKIGAKAGTHLTLHFTAADTKAVKALKLSRGDILALWVQDLGFVRKGVDIRGWSPFPWGAAASGGRRRDTSGCVLVRCVSNGSFNSTREGNHQAMEFTFLDNSTQVPTALLCSADKKGWKGWGWLEGSFSVLRLAELFSEMMIYDMLHNSMQALPAADRRIAFEAPTSVQSSQSLDGDLLSLLQHYDGQPDGFQRMALRLLSAPIFRLSLLNRGCPPGSQAALCDTGDAGIKESASASASAGEEGHRRAGVSSHFHSVAEEEAAMVAQNMTAEFRLNGDQQTVLYRVARWFCPSLPLPMPPKEEEENDEEDEEEEAGAGAGAGSDDIVLVQGVFGSGKSTLLAAICSLVARFNRSLGPRTTSITPVSGDPVRPAGNPVSQEVEVLRPACQMLVSAHTNAAVDRVMALLAERMRENGSGGGGIMNIARIARPEKLTEKGLLLPHLVCSGLGEKKIKDEITECIRTIERLKRRGGDDGEGERSNGELAVLPLLQSLLDKQDLAESMARRVLQADLVGVTTMSTTTHHLHKDAFDMDILIVDEASQLTESQALLAIAAARPRKMILVGDPKQLPPILQMTSHSHKGRTDHFNPERDIDPRGNPRTYERTLFDRLEAVGWHSTMLRTQYRCHPAIAAICNKCFYDDKLITGVSSGQRMALVPGLAPVRAVDWGPSLRGKRRYAAEQGKPFINNPVRQNGTSWTNELEASEIEKALGHILNGAERASSSSSSSSISTEQEPLVIEVGVICIYRAQVAALEDRFKHRGLSWVSSSKARTSVRLDIEIASVDSFQGKEKDVILLATTCSLYGDDGRHAFISSHLQDERRLNVAISRAKYHLLVFGDLTYLGGEQGLWSSILQRCGTGVSADELFKRESL